jgi:proton glutamate symport protein
MKEFVSTAPVATKKIPPVWLFSLLGLFSLTLLLHLLQGYQVASLPSSLLQLFRWTFVGGIFAFAFLQKRDLTTWIVVSMFVGAELGYSFPAFSVHLKVISDVFMKLIKCIIAPLLMGTLIVGIAGHSDMKQVGRMGWKSLVYFEIVTTIALFVGLAAINLTEAGVGIDLSSAASNKEALAKVKPQSWEEIVLHTFPENIAKSIANGEVLQIVVFSIIFAIGLAMLKDQRHKQVMISALESLSEVMFKFTAVIMNLAPFAVGAAIAVTMSKMGIDVFKNLALLLMTLYGALVVFLLGVLLPIALFLRVPIKKFIQAIAEPVSLAFSTASSEAALPKAMKAMESIGVPRKIVSFVMPTGYSFNLDGTTLYLALAAVFVAQAAYGTAWKESFPIETQLLMVFTLMLTSKGVAGVPRVSLVILSGLASSFNLPPEPIMVILGIDALMDMARTSVNVIGNCLATVVIAKWENEFGKEEIATE